MSTRIVSLQIQDERLGVSRQWDLHPANILNITMLVAEASSSTAEEQHAMGFLNPKRLGGSNSETSAILIQLYSGFGSEDKVHRGRRARQIPYI
jgi:hypothetical protein